MITMPEGVQTARRIWRGIAVALAALVAWAGMR